jgi:hypothetical protein
MPARSTDRQRPDVVLIEWVDSCSSSGWRRMSDIPAGWFCASRCETVGFLIDENDDSVTLALSRGVCETTSDFTETMTIPKVAITRRRQLRA